MNTRHGKLHNLTVLVTRPIGLAQQLAQKIEFYGGRAIIYPVISIETPDHNAQRDQLLLQLEDFDIAIFISPTAVKKTFEHINALPSTLRVAAVGSSTVKALEKQGVTVSIMPEGHDSEALLCHQQLQTEQINGKLIVIFRGVGGRKHLGNILTARGGAVSYAEMYQRVRPSNTASLTDNDLNTINIIAITSNEALQNLFDLTNNKSLLTRKPLIVPGERCKTLAETLGFVEIIASSNATDTACITALEKWLGPQKTPS